jgi:hypothetical protein
MATKRPLIRYADTGQIEELRSSDSLPGGGGGGSVSPLTVTISFPAQGATSVTQDVTVSGATIGQKVIASLSLDMPAGVAADELEMDMLYCAGAVIAADTVRLTVSGNGSALISGQRNINLILG